MQVHTKIDDEQAVVTSLPKVPQHESRGSQDRSIQGASPLLADYRVFASQSQKVAVQRIALPVSRTFGEIKLAALKSPRISRIGHALLGIGG